MRSHQKEAQAAQQVLSLRRERKLTEMNDHRTDHVRRLRLIAEISASSADYNRLTSTARQLLTEAADEIERLRRIVDSFDVQLGKVPTP